MMCLKKIGLVHKAIFILTQQMTDRKSYPYSLFLVDAWNNEQEDKERRDREKKTKRALDNWKKLIRGMMMYEKIKKKYANPK